jgi:hypothetical protein
MTTPFFEEAIPVLESLGFDAFKIASGDLTYDGLIAAAARTGAPLVISTGMSTLGEVRHAIEVARTGGAGGVGVLHCVSGLSHARCTTRTCAPSPRSPAACGVPVGLSDHGAGSRSAVAAVALGADIYERHFVLSDDPDAIDRPGVEHTRGIRRHRRRDASVPRAALGGRREGVPPVGAAEPDPSRRGTLRRWAAARRARRAGRRSGGAPSRVGARAALLA